LCSKSSSAWQLTYSTTVPTTSHCRTAASESIPPNCQPLVPKLGDRSLGLTFSTIQPISHRRGKDSYNHEGNKCLRILASTFAQRYSRADDKTVKSALVFNVVTMIRQAGGHFCKYENGAWFEVGDRCAREKVSAYFRDMLHTQYRSSAKAKTTLRRDRNRNKRQTQTQQLVDGAGGHISDDSSMSSSCWGSSTYNNNIELVY
jgi:hypothetical protein